MTFRPSAGAAAVFAFCVGLPAIAQTREPPVVITIEGPCALALNGEAMACAGVAYMAFPDTHRIDFTAITEQAGWAFSGERDQNDGGHYTLAVDSVVNPRTGRLQAQGVCAMDVAKDGHTVQGIECQAQTPSGVMMLKASGQAQAGTDDDDDDDDQDDGPDSLRG